MEETANCIRENVKKWIVKIEMSDSSFGTGFFIGPNIVCTCAHIFENVLPDDTILITWGTQQFSIHYQSCIILDKEDLAFLFIEVFNGGWLISNPSALNYSCSSESKYYSHGFSEQYQADGEPLTLEYSGLHNDDSSRPLLTFKGDHVREGMSGSPVVDLSTGYTIGIMRYSRDIDDSTGGRAIPFAFALDILLSRFPEYFFRTINYENNMLLYSGTPDLFAYFVAIHDNEKIKLTAKLFLQMCITHGASVQKLLHLESYLHTLYYHELPIKIDSYMLLAFFLKQEHDSETANNLLKAYIGYLTRSGVSVDIINRVSRFSDDFIFQFVDEIKRKIEKHMNNMKRMPIAGSMYLTQEQILSGPFSIFTPFEWDNKKSGTNLIKYINSQIHKGVNISIISDPGLGKTTLAKLLFYKMAESRINNFHNLVPVYVDMHNEQEDNNAVGSEEWIISKLEHSYGNVIMSRAYICKDYSNVVFILDSLDEYLTSAHSKRKILDFFNSYLFKSDGRFIILCRENYFNNYISNVQHVMQSETIRIRRWSRPARNKYITAYLTCIQNSRFIGRLKIKDIKKALNDSHFLSEISTTPLYLNMAIEVLADSFSQGQKVELCDLAELYEKFTRRCLKNELDKASSEFDSVKRKDINTILACLCVQLYMDSSVVQYGTTRIKYLLEKASKTALGSEIDWGNDLDLLGRYLINRTLIVNGETMQFIHSSFFEYYVSYYLYLHLIRKNSEPALLSQLLAIMFTPEISEFLNCHLRRKGVGISKKNTILINCTDCLRHLPELALQYYEQTIIREQITYILGLTNCPEATRFLKEHLDQESNSWVKRSIVIGLAFCGDTKALDAYIDQLYAERSNGGVTPENSVNIGFSLSYFGDQEFDEKNPTLDQLGPTCRKTVTHLVDQLFSDNNRPTWRLNLYTIVDLAYNRPCSYEDYTKTIRVLKPRINRAIQRISKINCSLGVSPWPELETVHQILESE